MPKFFFLSLLKKKKNTIFEVVVCYFEVELTTAIQFLLQFSDCVTLRNNNKMCGLGEIRTASEIGKKMVVL